METAGEDLQGEVGSTGDDPGGWGKRFLVPETDSVRSSSVGGSHEQRIIKHLTPAPLSVTIPLTSLRGVGRDGR